MLIRAEPSPSSRNGVAAGLRTEAPLPSLTKTAASPEAVDSVELEPQSLPPGPSPLENACLAYWDSEQLLRKLEQSLIKGTRKGTRLAKGAEAKGRLGRLARKVNQDKFNPGMATVTGGAFGGFAGLTVGVVTRDLAAGLTVAGSAGTAVGAAWGATSASAALQKKTSALRLRRLRAKEPWVAAFILAFDQGSPAQQVYLGARAQSLVARFSEALSKTAKDSLLARSREALLLPKELLAAADTAALLLAADFVEEKDPVAHQAQLTAYLQAFKGLDTQDQARLRQQLCSFFFKGSKTRHSLPASSAVQLFLTFARPHLPDACSAAALAMARWNQAPQWTDERADFFLDLVERADSEDLRKMLSRMLFSKDAGQQIPAAIRLRFHDAFRPVTEAQVRRAFEQYRAQKGGLREEQAQSLLLLCDRLSAQEREAFIAFIEQQLENTQGQPLFDDARVGALRVQLRA